MCLKSGSRMERVQVCGGGEGGVDCVRPMLLVSLTASKAQEGRQRITTPKGCGVWVVISPLKLCGVLGFKITTACIII